MAEAGTPEKVTELIKDIKLAMLTYQDSEGHLVSKPMATQDVDFDGDLWFIAERNTDKVHDMEANPEVNVAYAGRGSWVSVCGTARVVDDRAKLEELWSTFTDAWMEGGPENPNNILLNVQAHAAEYWDAPAGGAATQVVNFVKAKVTGERIEGENETVDLG